MYEYSDFKISIYAPKESIINIISYLHNNQIFNNNTSGYLNINLYYYDSHVVIDTGINKIYEYSIRKKFEGGLYFNSNGTFNIERSYSQNSDKYKSIIKFTKEFVKINKKHFNLLKLSLKNFLKVNNIPIIKDKECKSKYGHTHYNSNFFRIPKEYNKDEYFTYIDEDIRTLLASLAVYIENKLYDSTNIDDYKCDEVFTLDDENNEILEAADNKTNNEINTETVNDSKEETPSSNDTDKNILDDDIIKKLFLKYIDNAKKGVLEFENSFKKNENIKDADKKEAEEKIKAANFFILSAEYNIEKENDAMNYINNYNKTICQINSDFNNIMNRYRKISSLVYVMDIDMEDLIDIYIPKFDVNNILKGLLN
ncbi:hypothetical protein [Brachyspira innocens]|uniref:hypothetical protein n=1 Tax=Brachyspira innocens TaxID=13264 RepID=UPI00037D4CC6|nr:hypothetical protein [Brachyspira innocens]